MLLRLRQVKGERVLNASTTFLDKHTRRLSCILYVNLENGGVLTVGCQEIDAEPCTIKLLTNRSN